MLPSTRFRTLYQAENADEGSLLRAPCNTPDLGYVDALNRAVPLEETPAGDWHCDCGTLNAGQEFACGYCGRECDD